MKYQIWYDSKTGSVENFVNNLDTDFSINKIEEDVKKIDSKIILFTYTIGKGNVSETTQKFIDVNKANIISVSSCGATKFGANFGKAASEISKQLNIPIWLKFHKKGTEVDKLIIENYLNDLD